jgi:uncharacterized membrane-anchored protein
MVKILLYVNVIIAVILTLLLGFQLKLLYHYFSYASITSRDEAMFGLVMLSVMSLWLVVPATITGYLSRKSKPLLANIILLLCLIQAVIVAITAVT